jgi:hypothetical protein
MPHTPNRIPARKMRVAVQDGRIAVELAQAAADAVRAINHLTYHDTALPYPADSWRLLSQLATVAHRLPQALDQTAHHLTRRRERGLIGIDPGTEYAGNASEAVSHSLAGLARARRAAAELAAALDDAAHPLTYAHHADPYDDDTEYEHETDSDDEAFAAGPDDLGEGWS